MRTRKEGYTGNSALVERPFMFACRMEPGETMTKAEMNAACGIDLGADPTIWVRAKKRLEKAGVHFDNVRGIGEQRRRPIDYRYGMNKDAQKIVRSTKRAITLASSAPIHELPRHEQTNLSNGIGRLGFILLDAREVAAMGEPSPKGNRTPSPSRELLSVVQGKPYA